MKTPEIKTGTKEYIYIECPRCSKKIPGQKESEVIENYKRHEKACLKKQKIKDKTKK